jgi:diguanylate cyclase (GGDEF)-like protein
MNPSDVLSMFFGSALIIILIFADFYAEYVNRYSIDHAQKKMFCAVLLLSFILLAVDILVSLIFTVQGYLHLAVSCLTFVLVAFILFAFRKIYKKVILFTVLVLTILYGAGLFMDILTGSTKLIWPCICALLLYTYFVIAQNETKLDSLTGLGNRYSFYEFIDYLAKHHTESSWIIAMLDVDDIKTINSTYGHLEGDNVLRQLAAILKRSVRENDFACRYSGDEFILAARAEDGIENLLKDIKHDIEKYNMKSQKPYILNISYGFDMFSPDKSEHIEEFLIHIDGLMEKHKLELRRLSDEKNEEKVKS